VKDCLVAATSNTYAMHLIHVAKKACLQRTHPAVGEKLQTNSHLLDSSIEFDQGMSV
jgi:hypothetical protein